MIYYASKIDSPSTALILNMARFIADPDIKLRAHVTLRGPFKNETRVRKRKIIEINCEIKRHRYSISRIENFFRYNQSTVYFPLTISGSIIEWKNTVWYKKTFKGEFNPHITLYDGKDIEWAKTIYDEVKDFTCELEFSLSSIYRIKSEKGQKTLEPDFEIGYVEKLYQEAMKYAKMSKDGRIKIIKHLLFDELLKTQKSI